MSHGPSSEGSVAEPNLTPLLDVVLQLLMFFMMCVNFVTEQVNEDVKLPVSQAAKPMDKAETDVLFINLKPFRVQEFANRSADDLEKLKLKFQEGDPCLLVVGKFPMKPVEVNLWLRQMYADSEKNAKDGKVKTAIILRAHEDCEYAHVFQVMTMCKVVGYQELRLRAMTKSTLQS